MGGENLVIDFVWRRRHTKKRSRGTKAKMCGFWRVKENFEDTQIVHASAILADNSSAPEKIVHPAQFCAWCAVGHDLLIHESVSVPFYRLFKSSSPPLRPSAVVIEI